MKRGFLMQNNLGTPHPFRLKIDQNAEVSHTNHILPQCLSGAF